MLTSQILLWTAVIVEGLLIAALARQVGILHERIAPAGALTLHQKVEVGEVASPMTLVTIDGAPVEIGGKRDGRSQLLFFASPDCPVCKSLLPVVRSAASAEADWLDVIVAGDGSKAEYLRLRELHTLERVPMVLSEALGRAFGVSKLPYAVLLDEQGKVASLGLVNSREHLESLFEAKERGVASIQDFLARRKGA
ncbi:thioredoxin fold domain-containing protein [Novosphingobium taihuense]|uniref:Methylamine dehydrogenase accessory protein MauD n=1 Tax=Novosphingobium taihuense TaxID=260085 RepID=A0A7W7EVS7_9SPHN|nr:thioredoxin fold domain-containing protein [Novosphingobium taihuense]MBB4613550.1 methylamine dehydrogenase accessory protein MauD [Novosphingobium taihuense]TWH81206.1 methylamine dehydrogenase accessory protein MauD [Novosphingobium taihuense]